MPEKFLRYLLAFIITASLFTGCGSRKNDPAENTSSAVQSPETSAVSDSAADTSSSSAGSLNAGSAGNEASGTDPAADSSSASDTNDDGDSAILPPDLEVRFGDGGEPFLLHLNDSETAAEIAEIVGTAGWRLPIYHYDDYDNYEVMQYYDIPGRYEIPSNPETVVSENAGEVYYSEPNRIILFYQDAEITGEYTKIGSFDYTEEFAEAVGNNPVLEGWGNKIVLIDRTD